MSAPILALLLLQSPCLEPASARAAEFDLPGAAKLLEGASCTNADVARLYVRGLIDARAAFSQGGSPESLAPVRRAIAQLDAIARSQPGPAEIARLTLQAAAAAAQSERDEMRVYLDSAVRMEWVQRSAGQAGAPIVMAAEVAGDFWLQMFRYEDARAAYQYAQTAIGPTPRVLIGLARTAARLGDSATACASYRTLIDVWPARSAVTSEILEARTYFAQPACAR